MLYVKGARGVANRQLRIPFCVAELEMASEGAANTSASKSTAAQFHSPHHISPFSLQSTMSESTGQTKESTSLIISRLQSGRHVITPQANFERFVPDEEERQECEQSARTAIDGEGWNTMKIHITRSVDGTLRMVCSQW